MSPQPIFILASPRSFTSLLCAMLGQHPEIYGVPELSLFSADNMEQWLQQLKEQPKKSHGLLRTVSQLYAGEQTILSIAMARRWMLNRIHYTTGEVYQEICHKVAPLRIIDKSPAYALDTQSLKRIHQAFPGAYYLHLVRHPKPQGESLMKLVPQIRLQKEQQKSLVGATRSISPLLINCIDNSTSPATIDFQYLWYRMQQRIRDFLQIIPPERQMFLRGEDILNEPRLHFENICQWLGLAWSDSAMNAMLHPEDSPYACFGPYGAHLGNDPNFLGSPVFKQRTVSYSTLEGALPWRSDGGGFLPAVAELAQQLGYK
ncbi:MAG: sulfotransferase [Chroococcus sp. CMT-3BRIN-NPC107]|jgi:hypothetical protein|nr:sulfotransferase [Chroococcus sp. CMT-3BRIN-NPC107]